MILLGESVVLSKSSRVQFVRIGDVPGQKAFDLPLGSVGGPELAVEVKTPQRVRRAAEGNDTEERQRSHLWDAADRGQRVIFSEDDDSSGRKAGGFGRLSPSFFPTDGPRSVFDQCDPTWLYECGPRFSLRPIRRPQRIQLAKPLGLAVLGRLPEAVRDVIRHLKAT
jgi:hypothetical protein